MNISRMYDATWKIKNGKLAALCYKVNKLLVNTIYPKTVKLVWGLDEESDVIVSLTSFPARIDAVWITIATILNQTVKPRKIILWLAEEQFPNREKDIPSNLVRLKKYGLSIQFCDNLYPHKKYYYTMIEYPDTTVLTVDDDVFYPEYMIEKLVKISREYPGAVCCTWAHRITFDKYGDMLPYEKWQHCVADNKEPEMKLMPVGIGGVLYPPHTLDKRVFDKDKLSELALMTDDLWLKAMEVLKGTKVVRISEEYKQTYFTLIHTQNGGLHKANVGKLRNDMSINLIVDQYPQIIRIMKEDET